MAEAVLKCDLPTVQKYVEKLGTDVNKALIGETIDNVEDPTYLFLSVYWSNEGSDIEKRRMAKYLLEHGAEIDSDTFFFVLENRDYEMLRILYAYGKFPNGISISLGNLDRMYSPISSIVDLFGNISGENYKNDKQELSEKYWSLLDYYQSPLLHRWMKGYSYNAQRNFYLGTYNGHNWVGGFETDDFYMLRLLCFISGTNDYEKCNHTVWLMAEDLEHVKQYLREGESFHEIDYMAMNLIKNQELISFLEDLDFYKPSNIKTKKLGPYALTILELYFSNTIDKNTIDFLNAVYSERVAGITEENSKIIEQCIENGMNLHTPLANFSEATPFVFAAMYCYPETLDKIIALDTNYDKKMYYYSYSDEITFYGKEKSCTFKCPEETIEYLREKMR